MELWIRSQDRKKLVKSGYLTIFLSGANWFIYSDTTTGEPFEIGKYKTEERALEVLNEIQKYINGGCKQYINTGVYHTSKYEYRVYEMPKE